MKRANMIFSNFCIPHFMWNNHCHGDSLETWTSICYEREHTTTSHCGSKKYLQSFLICGHGNIFKCNIIKCSSFMKFTVIKTKCMFQSINIIQPNYERYL